MNPQKEKRLQRGLRIATILAFLLTLFILFKELGQEKEIADVSKTALLPKATSPKAPSPAEEKKKVKRHLSPLSLPQSFETLQKEATKEPRNPKYYEALGDLSFEKKNFKKAEEYYDAALALNQKSEEIFTKLLRSLLAQRKFLEAKNRLDGDSWNTPIFQLYRGLLASLFNQGEKAKQYLREAKEGGIPEVSEKANAILQAYEEFEFTTDGKVEHLQVLLAKAFDQIGEYEPAITLALEAIKSKDDYRDAWIVLGHAYAALEKWSDAKAALERSIELDSTNALSHFYLGVVEAALANNTNSIKAFEKAESLGLSGGPFADLQKAKHFDSQRQYQEALNWYKRVLEAKGPHANPEEYVRPVVIAIEHLNAFGLAYELALKNLEYHPRDAISLNLVGYAELSLSRVVDAKKHLEEALALDPELPAAHYNLGKLAEFLGDRETAHRRFTKAFELAKRRKDESIERASSAKLSSL